MEGSQTCASFNRRGSSGAVLIDREPPRGQEVACSVAGGAGMLATSAVGPGTRADAVHFTLHRRSHAVLSPTPIDRVDNHSHSIVAGGLLEMSYTTRFTPSTSLMMRLLIVASTSYGIRAQSAVMKSCVSTARTATTES